MKRLRLLLLFFLACATALHAKDFLGKEIAKPEKTARIIVTCYGGAVQELAIFVPQKIIAHPGAARFVFFEKLFPDLATKESVGTFNDVNLETLFKLKPDVVILSNNKNFQTSRDAIKKNPLYKNLKAVQNDRVFIAPVGGFWWDRPSPEAILGIVWLAKVLYPDAMREINLYETTAKFYKDFYGYNLSKEAYATFFATTKEQI